MALGVALGEAARGVREVGGNNQGPDVLRYLREAGIAVPAAWCAGFVNSCASGGARLLKLASPLEQVSRQALVADYVTFGKAHGWLVGPDAVRPGDLVCFRFGATPAAYNHIGFVMDPPVRLPGGGWSPFWTVEGNTGADGGRDGDGVYLKIRTFNPERVCFLAWDGGLDPNPT